MAINRRNVLLGLGAIVGGGGALVGTGAFSSVSAARSVSVTTAGDSSAALTISSLNTDYTTTTNGELSIQLGSTTGLNREAVTEYSGILEVTNNAADGNEINVGLADSVTDNPTPSTGETAIRINDGSDNAAIVTLTLGDGTVQSLTAGNSATITVTVDTRDQEYSNSTATKTSEFVIVAADTTV